MYHGTKSNWVLVPLRNVMCSEEWGRHRRKRPPHPTPSCIYHKLSSRFVSYRSMGARRSSKAACYFHVPTSENRFWSECFLWYPSFYQMKHIEASKHTKHCLEACIFQTLARWPSTVIRSWLSCKLSKRKTPSIWSAFEKLLTPMGNLRNVPTAGPQRPTSKPSFYLVLKQTAIKWHWPLRGGCETNKRLLAQLRLNIPANTNKKNLKKKLQWQVLHFDKNVRLWL